jgi:hypothetical protein
VNTSPSWSRKLARLLLIEVIILTTSGCGSLLAFTPERAAVDALLGPPELTDRPKDITPGSVKVAQTQGWQNGFIVVVTFSTTEEDAILVDCLFIFEVTREPSSWSAVLQEKACGPVGGSGEPFQRLQSQLSGTNIPGMTTAYGQVFDSRIRSIDLLWEDGERETVEVINGTYLSLREGVHETVYLRPLDAIGDLVE